jgi:hypothetical protein
MRSQIRPAPAFAFLKLFTGFTPGMLFQIATSLSGGQAAASSASSFWLANESNGVAVVAAASSGVANALTLVERHLVMTSPPDAQQCFFQEGPRAWAKARRFRGVRHGPASHYR